MKMYNCCTGHQAVQGCLAPSMRGQSRKCPLSEGSKNFQKNDQKNFRKRIKTDSQKRSKKHPVGMQWKCATVARDTRPCKAVRYPACEAKAASARWVKVQKHPHKRILTISEKGSNKFPRKDQLIVVFNMVFDRIYIWLLIGCFILFVYAVFDMFLLRLLFILCLYCFW